MRVLTGNVSFCLGVAVIVWSLAGCQSPSGATARPAHGTNDIATETPAPVEGSASAPRSARVAEDGEGDRVEAWQAVASPRATTKIRQIENSLKTLEAIPSRATTKSF